MNAAHPITMVNWFSRGWHTFKMRHKTLIGGSVILSVFYLLVQPFKWVEQDSSGLLLLPGVSVPFLATYVAGRITGRMVVLMPQASKRRGGQQYKYF